MLIPRSKRNNVWGKDVYLQLEPSYQTSFHYYYELYFVNVGHKSHVMLY